MTNDKIMELCKLSPLFNELSILAEKTQLVHECVVDNELYIIMPRRKK